jgi:hypothetical protein
MRTPSSGDGYDYVRQAYGVEVKVGDIVTVDNEPGEIVKGAEDQYIYVRFDVWGQVVPCHPTWKFVRFEEAS